MELVTKSQIDARPSGVQLGLQKLNEKYVPILFSLFSSWREKLSHWFLILLISSQACIFPLKR